MSGQKDERLAAEGVSVINRRKFLSGLGAGAAVVPVLAKGDTEPDLTVEQLLERVEQLELDRGGKLEQQIITASGPPQYFTAVSLSSMRIKK